MNTAIWIIAICMAVNTVFIIISAVTGWIFTHRFLKGDKESWP